MIPFEIGDGVIAQQRVQPLEQIIADLLPSQVECKLAAHGRAIPPFEMEAPIGVREIEIAFGRDHFRLDPQAEIHAQRVHPLD